MHIAIIDDDEVFAEELKKVISIELLNYNIEDYQIITYRNGDSIYSCIDRFDVVFLDVEIGLENGIEISEKIRNLNKAVSIIFISSYETYVFNSFSVNPFTYILKNKLNTEGVDEIKRYIEYYINENLSLTIESFGISYTLNQRIIKIISKNGNKCDFVYNGKIFTSILNLSHIIPFLAPYFVQINKSELINLHYVEDIAKEQITLTDNEKYYISRRRVKMVNSAWIRYLKTRRN